MEEDEEVHWTQTHAEEHAYLQPMIIIFSNLYALREKELRLESMKIPLQFTKNQLGNLQICCPRRKENGYKLIFNIKHRPNDDLRHTWLKKDIYKLNE